MNLISSLNITHLSPSELKTQYPYFFTSSLDFESSISKTNLQSEFKEVFNQGMSGICFSAYQSNQEPREFITED